MRPSSSRAQHSPCYTTTWVMVGGTRRPTPAPHDRRRTHGEPHGAGHLSGSTATRFRSDTPCRARRDCHKWSSGLHEASGAWLPGICAARRAQRMKARPQRRFLVHAVYLRPRADDKQLTLSSLALYAAKRPRSPGLAVPICPFGRFARVVVRRTLVHLTCFSLSSWDPTNFLPSRLVCLLLRQADVLSNDRCFCRSEC